MRDENLSPDERELDAFAMHLARPLRAPESLDATFEARVMSAVLAEGRERRRAAPAAMPPARGWWRRSRAVHVSPLGGLAIAAGLAAVAALGAMGGAAMRAPRAGPEPVAVARAVAPETVHVVRFVLSDPSAHAVSLVGDFNGWAKGATPLVAQDEGGTWSVSLPVAPGRHEYAFVVEGRDGEQWIADPLATTVRDEFGVESSLVTVGRPPDPLPRRGST